MYIGHVDLKHATEFSYTLSTATQSKGAVHGLLMTNAQGVWIVLKRLCSSAPLHVAGRSISAFVVQSGNHGFCWAVKLLSWG
jgi:hypothetical protein